MGCHDSSSLLSTSKTVTEPGNLMYITCGTSDGSIHNHLSFLWFNFWSWLKLNSSEKTRAYHVSNCSVIILLRATFVLVSLPTWNALSSLYMTCTQTTWQFPKNMQLTLLCLHVLQQLQHIVSCWVLADSSPLMFWKAHYLIIT